MTYIVYNIYCNVYEVMFVFPELDSELGFRYPGTDRLFHTNSITSDSTLSPITTSSVRYICCPQIQPKSASNSLSMEKCLTFGIHFHFIYILLRKSIINFYL